MSSVDCQVVPYDQRRGRCGVYIDCEQNGDTSKHWVSTGPTASQLTCHGDDNHWADEEEMRKRLCRFINDLSPDCADDFPSMGNRLVIENFRILVGFMLLGNSRASWLTLQLTVCEWHDAVVDVGRPRRLFYFFLECRHTTITNVVSAMNIHIVGGLSSAT